MLAALLAALAVRLIHGLGHSYASYASYAMAIEDLGIAIWGYGELTDGVNWFRRLAGLAFLVLTVMTVAKSLYA